MSLHLKRDLKSLKKEIRQLGSMVEAAISNAIIALRDRRPELADQVFENDDMCWVK